MAIPTIDLSPFLTDGEDDACGAGKKKAIDSIQEACRDYGFFQIINHGVPLHLMATAFQLSTTFFAFPEQEKLKSSPGSGAPLPAGYTKHPHHSPDKNEYLLMFPPQSGFNVLPSDPPAFREVLEEMFLSFWKTAEVIEKILDDCLGLPPGFLKQYNSEGTWDFMVALRYFPASDTENNGLLAHEDSNIITFVIQDEVGGLELQKDGKWIPVIPAPGTIVVNIGDTVQVLSNKKFKSATHKVVRAKDRWRHSFAFFYNVEGEKWIEPLAKFTEEIGEAPKYRRFQYKEYQAMRMKNKSHPPARPEDAINITYYEIPTD